MEHGTWNILEHDGTIEHIRNIAKQDSQEEAEVYLLVKKSRNTHTNRRERLIIILIFSSLGTYRNRLIGCG